MNTNKLSGLISAILVGISANSALIAAEIEQNNWQTGRGSPVISSTSDGNLTWGDNTPDNAIDSAVHASFTSITLEEGDVITLSGDITFKGAETLPNAKVFRYGLFDADPATNSNPNLSGNNGWLGYFVSNDSIDEGNSGLLRERKSDNKEAYYSQAEADWHLRYNDLDGGSDNFRFPVNDNTYTFTMSIKREFGELVINANLNDGFTTFGDFSYRDSSPNTFSFNRVGLFSDDPIAADQIILTGVDVSFSQEPIDPTEVVVKPFDHKHTFISGGANYSLYGGHLLDGVPQSHKAEVLDWLFEDISNDMIRSSAGGVGDGVDGGNDELENDNDDPFTLDLSKFNFSGRLDLGGRVYKEAIKRSSTVETMYYGARFPHWLKKDNGGSKLQLNYDHPYLYEEIAEWLFANMIRVKVRWDMDINYWDMANEPDFGKKLDRKGQGDIIAYVPEHLQNLIDGPQNTYGVKMPKFVGPNTLSVRAGAAYLEQWKTQQPDAWENLGMVSTHPYGAGYSAEHYQSMNQLKGNRQFWQNEMHIAHQSFTNNSGRLPTNSLALHTQAAIALGQIFTIGVNNGLNGFTVFDATGPGGNNGMGIVATPWGKTPTRRLGYYVFKQLTKIQPYKSSVTEYEASNSPEGLYYLNYNNGSNKSYLTITNAKANAHQTTLKFVDREGDLLPIESIEVTETSEAADLSQKEAEVVATHDANGALEYTISLPAHSISTLAVTLDANITPAPIGSIVWLRSVENDQYLSVSSVDNQETLVVEGTSVGDSQKFWLKAVDGQANSFNLISIESGQPVSVTADTKLVIDSTLPAAVFTWQSVGDDMTYITLQESGVRLRAALDTDDNLAMINDAGAGQWTQFEFGIEASTPQPTQLTAVNDGGGAMSWQAPAQINLSHYHLYESVNNGEFEMVANINTPHTSYTRSGDFEPASNYQYYLAAVYADGVESQASETVTINYQAGVDTVAPQIEQPSPITLEFREPPMALNLAAPEATDDVDGKVAVSHNLSLPLAFGKHEVIWRAADGYGNVATVSQELTIKQQHPHVELGSERYINVARDYQSVTGESRYRTSQYPFAAAFDGVTSGNNDSRWLSSGDSATTWLEITLNEAKPISGMRVYTSGGAELNDFELQQMVDGNWQTVHAVTGNDFSKAEFFFDPASNDHFRLYITKTGKSDNIVRLFELELLAATDAVTGISDNNGVISWQEYSNSATYNVYEVTADQEYRQLATGTTDAQAGFNYQQVLPAGNAKLAVEAVDGSTLSTLAFIDVDVTATAMNNQAPSAKIRDISTPPLAEQIQVLNGSDSSDPENNTLSYVWTQATDDELQVSLSNANTALAKFTVPSVEQTTELNFTLTVSDGEFAVNDTIVLNLEPPVVIPPMSISVSSANVSLEAGASVDLTVQVTNGDEANIEWSQIDGDISLALANPTTKSVTVTAPAQNSGGTVMMQVEVSLGDVSQTAQVSVQLQATPEPTDPEPTDPEPTDPAPTDPEPTDPVTDTPDPEPSDSDSGGGSTSISVLLLLFGIVIRRCIHRTK